MTVARKEGNHGCTKEAKEESGETKDQGKEAASGTHQGLPPAWSHHQVQGWEGLKPRWGRSRQSFGGSIIVLMRDLI
jgi:hypothetical protein